MTAAIAPGTRLVAAVKSGRALRWPSKDPAELLDYAIDWTERLAGDAIAHSTFKLPPCIVAKSSSHSEAVATVWLACGVKGRSCLIVNQVTTKAGRQLRQAVKIKIKAKSRK